MTGDPPALNDGERQVLALLGEGHTAKSIAAITGLSVHAVNERLRPARRKTGIGSSRELARKLRADTGDAPQETWHNPIGVADSRSEGEGRGAAPDRRGMLIAKGPLVMSALALATAAVAAIVSLAGQHRASVDAAAERPRVVATSPAAGSTIPAGPFALSVTFDRPMRGDSYSFVTTDLAPYPDCKARPRQSGDRRTFTLRCTAKAGQRYAIGFNHGRFRNFASLDGGVPALPATLAFRVR